MSLIQASISRGSTVLVEHRLPGKRDFSSAIGSILAKIPPNDSKLTCAYSLSHSMSSSSFLSD